MKIIDTYETEHRELNLKYLPFKIGDIIDIYPEKRRVLVSSNGQIINKKPFYVYEFTHKELEIIIFEYRKYLKSQTNIEDRIADFEWRINGSYSIERFYEVRESRLRKNEHNYKLLN